MTADLDLSLVALVDTLLPGRPPFPPASMVGVQADLRRRWPELYEAPGLAELVARIEATTGSLAAAGPDERARLLTAFQAREPDLFTLLRRVVYLSYYATAPVVAVIRSLGHDLNLTPQPAGYAADPFDRARDMPRAVRGRVVATADIRRVDLSGLTHLDPVAETAP